GANGAQHLRIAERRGIALLLQLEPRLVHAARGIDREHKLQVDRGVGPRTPRKAKEGANRQPQPEKKTEAADHRLISPIPLSARVSPAPSPVQTRPRLGRTPEPDVRESHRQNQHSLRCPQTPSAPILIGPYRKTERTHVNKPDLRYLAGPDPEHDFV